MKTPDMEPVPKLEQLERHSECMVAKVKTFEELRYALDEAESRMWHLASQVDAIGSTIETFVDFHEHLPFCGMETGVVRFRWSMLGRRSIENVIDEAIRRRDAHENP